MRRENTMRYNLKYCFVLEVVTGFFFHTRINKLVPETLTKDKPSSSKRFAIPLPIIAGIKIELICNV